MGYRDLLPTPLKHFHKFAHTLRCHIADDGDVKVVRDTDLFGVDEIDGDAWRTIAYESGSRINLHGSADDDEYIRLLACLCGRFNLRYRFAKPNDERTEERAVGCLFARKNFEMVGGECGDVARVFGGAARAGLHQFAMEIDDIRRTGTGMQVVDVLRDDGHVVVLLKFRQQQMSLVGAGIHQLPAQAVVEFVHKNRIFVPSLGSSHFFHRITLPQSAAVAESGKAAFGTHPGAGEHHNFLFHSRRF